MTKYWIQCMALFFLLFSTQVLPSQEAICNDGIDNDGDGFIDCSDGDCTGLSVCTSPVVDCTYLGNGFSFVVAGSPVVGYVDEFLLTDLFGDILAISNTNSFSNVLPGDYQLFHLNYHSNTPVTGNEVNANISNIAGECFEVSGGFTIKVCPDNASCQLNLGLWLEGAFEPNLGGMQTILNDFQLLPGQKPIFFLGTETPAGQPFQAQPWDYSGTEGDAFDYQTVGNDRAGYPIDVVDWVLISLRATMEASSTFCTKAAWVLADGTVSFPLPCDCSLSQGQSVFIVVEHRNHLPIMTPTLVTVDAQGLSYDFRTNQSYISFFGDGQTILSNGQYAMFAANGEQVNTIQSRMDVNALDESIWTMLNSFGDTYNAADYNLDGDINANDESKWHDNTGKSSDVDFN